MCKKIVDLFILQGFMIWREKDLTSLTEPYGTDSSPLLLIWIRKLTEIAKQHQWRWILDFLDRPPAKKQTGKGVVKYSLNTHLYDRYFGAKKITEPTINPNLGIEKRLSCLTHHRHPVVEMKNVIKCNHDSVKGGSKQRKGDPKSLPILELGGKPRCNVQVWSPSFQK